MLDDASYIVRQVRFKKNEQGEVTGAINCFYDITQRKQAEEQLQEANVKLAESYRRKSDFLAMLSHELRNPLATIRSGLQVMRLTDAPAVNRITALMERQVGHLVGLVDDLLDVNRISRGKIDLHRGRIELATIVQTAVESARSLSERMGHELIVTLPSEPIWVYVDPIRLVQVVGNLLNNACKFTEKGGRIRLSVEREGEQAVIRVRDNGMGIAADQLSPIFDMFMQADASMEHSNSGLGIGLALVQDLLKMHGGTVEARSAGLGHGSEFVVRLPIAVEAPPTRSAGPPLKELSNTTVRRILIVDDNRDAAESLAMLLKLTGHETHIAHDGLEAVETAAQVSPDLILLDIGLPKINGYEAARRIRNLPGGQSMVLVAVTGWAQDEDRKNSGIGVRWSHDQAGEGRPPYEFVSGVSVGRQHPLTRSSTPSTSTLIILSGLAHCLSGCWAFHSVEVRRCAGSMSYNGPVTIRPPRLRCCVN